MPRCALRIDIEVKADMLALPPSIKPQINAFLMRLAENPYSPQILESATEHPERFFTLPLSCGCTIFWEIILPPRITSIKNLDRILIRVVGVAPSSRKA